MTRLIDFYRHQMLIDIIIQFQYRAGMVIWMLEIIIQPVIYLVVWQSAAGGGEIGGYAARDFAAYYIVLLIVMHFTQMWHMWEYEWRIRQGHLNMLLLRPMHPVHRDAAANITYKILMSSVVVPMVIVLIIVFDPLLETPLWALAAAAPVVVLAGVLMFTLGWVVAMAAFWTVRITAINQVYFLAVLFFSGEIAPLSVLPGAVRTVASILPFRWCISFPIELILGRLTFEETLSGVGVQLLWLLVGALLLRFVWLQAVRHYSAVGG
jgi:ABC-2 type transport system permease protein